MTVYPPPTAGEFQKYQWRHDVDMSPCSHCGAQAGQWCVTRDGRVATYVHKPRFNAAVARGEITIYSLKIT